MELADPALGDLSSTDCIFLCDVPAITAAMVAKLESHLKRGGGVVIGTEHEPEKARLAHAHFEEAGLADLIELREGDLRETLKTLEGPIDFVLVDIWVEMARPALELVAPHLRPGAVVCADNTISASRSYAAYFAFVNDPANGLVTQTLPFEGGFEMTVKVG